MDVQAATRFASNPFSTKFIRPGAIDFNFEQSADAFQIIAAFERFGRRGQIVGPHGSGKSTLLRTLRPLLECSMELHWAKVQPAVCRGLLSRPDCHGGGFGGVLRQFAARIFEMAKFPLGRSFGIGSGSAVRCDRSHSHLRHGLVGPRAKTTLPKPVVWVVDGFDRLSWITRQSIQRTCRQEKLGLLVTTHRDLKLPMLSRPSLTFAAFRGLVQDLLRPSPVTLGVDEIRRAYDRHFPNVREALFMLYDCHEARRRG